MFLYKITDLKENLQGLQISNLEPTISGKWRALRKWHFQYVTFLRKCTFGANCDQGAILEEFEASLKCRSECVTQARLILKKFIRCSKENQATEQ